MVIYSREKVARLREQYPAGTRICLNSMDGEAGMPQGLEGTVQYVDDAGQLGVKWDNIVWYPRQTAEVSQQRIRMTDRT